MRSVPKIERLVGTSNSRPMLIGTVPQETSDVEALFCGRLLHPSVGRCFAQRGGQDMHDMIRRLLRRARQRAEEPCHCSVVVTGLEIRVA